MLLTYLLTGASIIFAVMTILLGGIVHATGSSLGCPDWPLCFGQWFPAMEGAVLYEHSHRIVAGLSAVLVWAAGISASLSSRVTRIQRRFLYLTMGLILVQAGLGGITVLWRLPTWVSTSHFFLGQATLALLVVVFWSMNRSDGSNASFLTRARPEHAWLSAGMFLVVAVQMLLGAVTRHMGSPAPLVSPDQTRVAGLLIPCGDFPLCDPVWLDWMTGQYLWVYWGHRLFAVLVVGLIAWGVWSFRRYRTSRPRLFHLSLIAVTAALIQVILGVFTVRSYLEPVSVTLHYAGAMLLMVTLLLLMLESFQPRELVRDD